MKANSAIILQEKGILMEAYFLFSLVSFIECLNLSLKCFKNSFVKNFFSEEAINRDAEMCNAAMEQGNPQV